MTFRPRSAIMYPTPQGGVGEADLKEHEDVIKRLKNIEGHIRGVGRMVENDAYCIDVINQIQAVQSALSKVSTLVFNAHLNSCLITAVRGSNPEEREKVLQEIIDVFEAATKV